MFLAISYLNDEDRDGYTKTDKVYVDGVGTFDLRDCDDVRRLVANVNSTIEEGDNSYPFYVKYNGRGKADSIVDASDEGKRYKLKFNSHQRKFTAVCNGYLEN